MKNSTFLLFQGKVLQGWFEQRQVLLNIARGEQQSIQSGSQIMRTLLQRELLEQVDGCYRLQVPLYQIYIEQMGTELLSEDS